MHRIPVAYGHSPTQCGNESVSVRQYACENKLTQNVGVSDKIRMEKVEKKSNADMVHRESSLNAIDSVCHHA